MGIIRQGILGGFRKKTGSVVGAYWRTLDTIRGLPRKSGKAPTEAQLLQQSRFGIVTQALSWISPLIDVGFKAKAKIKTPMNLAVEYHLENALHEVAGELAFDYTQLRFSQGPLSPATLVDVISPALAKIKFSWAIEGNNHKHQDITDMVSVMAYNPVKRRYVMMLGVVPRSALTYTLDVPAAWSGDMVMCYYSLSSVKTKKLVSDSEYLGTIPVL